ncbi:chromate transporter, partial [Escherichia coli]|uniref:chromate transporter n=1 Tax=Escherichia coli TaxID=562 RepID=UPI0020219B7D
MSPENIAGQSLSVGFRPLPPTTPTTSHDESSAVRGSAGEVVTTFLKLGFTSFGGPIAHLGYFRDELVSRRKWIDEQGYADL